MKDEIKRRIRARKKRVKLVKDFEAANATNPFANRPSAEDIIRLMTSSILLDEASDRCLRQVRAMSYLKAYNVHPGLVHSALQLLLMLDYLDMLPCMVVPLPDREDGFGIRMDFGNPPAERSAEIEIRQGAFPEIVHFGGPGQDSGMIINRCGLDDFDRLLEMKAHLGLYVSASEMLTDRAMLPVFSVRYGMPDINHGEK